MPPTPPITVSLSTSLPIVADGSLPADVTLTFSQPVTDEQIQANLKGRVIYDGTGGLISVNEEMNLCEPEENFYGFISTSAEPSNTRTLHFNWPHGSTGHTFRITSIGWGDYPALTPQDYVGIKLSNGSSAISNFGQLLANGQEIGFIFNEMLLKVKLESGVLKYYGTNCSPIVSGSVASYTGDYDNDEVTITSYSCSEEDLAAWVTNVEEWFDTMLPSLNISSAQYMGYSADVPQAFLWAEL